MSYQENSKSRKWFGLLNMTDRCWPGGVVILYCWEMIIRAKLTKFVMTGPNLSNEHKTLTSCDVLNVDIICLLAFQP
jgi:hypothetical protein